MQAKQMVVVHPAERVSGYAPQFKFASGPTAPTRCPAYNNFLFLLNHHIRALKTLDDPSYSSTSTPTANMRTANMRTALAGSLPLCTTVINQGLLSYHGTVCKDNTDSPYITCKRPLSDVHELFMARTLGVRRRATAICRRWFDENREGSHKGKKGV
jgi:hypothetical protein